MLVIIRLAARFKYVEILEQLPEFGIQAEEDALVWHLPLSDFDDLLERFPLLDEYFSSHLQTRLSAATQVRHSVTQVRDLLKRPPVTIAQDASIREAATLMSRENVSSVLVMEEDTLAGIVTDKDLRQRVIAAGRDTAQPIREVMTDHPMTLQADSGVDAALLLMMRENYHHLPVLDEERPVGLVTAGDILRSQSEHPLRLVRDIYKRQSVEELVRLSGRLPSLFERMVTLGRDVEKIGCMVTHITDAFTIRLLQLAAAGFNLLVEGVEVLVLDLFRFPQGLQLGADKAFIGGGDRLLGPELPGQDQDDNQEDQEFHGLLQQRVLFGLGVGLACCIRGHEQPHALTAVEHALEFLAAYLVVILVFEGECRGHVADFRECHR